MKLGIVGSGTIVQEFLPKLVKLDGVDIIGIMDLPQSYEHVKAMCYENGVKNAYTDFDQMADSGIDTVYIAVPNFLHFDYCVQSIKKKLNVIVEKPMTSNYNEAIFLEKLAHENNCFLFEAITTLYFENYKKIQQWLPRIGEIKLVQAQYSQYSRRYDAFRNGQVLPAFDPAKSGGALMDLNLYNMHFVMGLFGQPDEVSYYANIERGIDTSGILMMKYPSFFSSCVAAKDSKGWQGCIIQGVDGCIKCEYPANFVGKVTLELYDGTVEEYDDKGYTERLIPEFTSFMKAINNGDYDFCYNKLTSSVNVTKVQTLAREKAHIIFDADKKKLG